MMDSASKIAASIKVGFSGCDALSKVPGSNSRAQFI